MDTQEGKYFLALLLIVSLISIIIASFTLIIFNYFKSINKLKKINAVSQIASLEYERERIAADLHDEIGPLLASIKLRIKLIEKNKEKNDFDTLNTQLLEVSQKIGSISRNLMPRSLEVMGLNNTIKELISSIKNAECINITFETNYKKSISKEIDLQLYRIIQESLLNAIKHAEASTIEIHLTKSNNWILLEVKDDGIGINSNTVTVTDGTGLKSIKNRVLLLGGDFSIRSLPSHGTSLRFEIPLDE